MINLSGTKIAFEEISANQKSTALVLENDDQYRTWALDFFLLLAGFNWEFKKMLWPFDNIAQIIYSSAWSTRFLLIYKNPKLL